MTEIARPAREPAAPTSLRAFVSAVILLAVLPFVLDALMAEFAHYRGRSAGLLAGEIARTVIVIGLTGLVVRRITPTAWPDAAWFGPASRPVTLGAVLLAFGLVDLLGRVHMAVLVTGLPVLLATVLMVSIGFGFLRPALDDVGRGTRILFVAAGSLLMMRALALIALGSA